MSDPGTGFLARVAWQAVETLGLGVVNQTMPLLRAYMHWVPLRIGRLPIMGMLMHYHKSHRSREVEAQGPLGMRFVGETRDEIHAAVWLCGVWEPNLTHWVSQRLGVGDGFVDLGANNGYFSLLASQLIGPQGWVVGIEAQPGTYARFLRNLELNAAANVRPVQVAVFDRIEMMPLYSPDLAAHPGLTSLLDTPGFAAIGSVQATTLDRVLTPQELRTMRLIKIDIEGAEWNVLPSLAGLLPECRSDLEIVVEITPYSGRSTAELLAPFVAQGFRVYVLADDVLDLILPPDPPREPECLSTLELSERSNVILSRASAI